MDSSNQPFSSSHQMSKRSVIENREAFDRWAQAVKVQMLACLQKRSKRLEN